MRDCFKFCLAPSVYKDKKDTKIGDIVLKDGSIVSSDLYKSTMSEPIGIVVSSNSNKVKMMALDFYKDENNPYFTFGGYKADGYTYHTYSENFKFFPNLTEDITINGNGEFPSDGFEGVQIEGTKYYYQGNNEQIPYSYLTDAVENPEYAILDINGKINTLNLLNEDLEDDMVDFNPIIIALLSSEDAEWYVPAIGELTKAFMHLKEINKARKKIGLEEIGDLDGDNIWSSTVASSDEVWAIELYYGTVSSLSVDDSLRILLFAEI